MIRWTLCGILLCLVVHVAHAVAQTEWHRYESSQVHMGSKVTITLYAYTQEEADEAFKAGFEAIDRVDRAVSTYRVDSDLNALNASAGEGPVKVGGDLQRLLIDAHYVARLTGGKFDPTVGALTGIWGEAIRTRTAPNPSAIEAARALVGYEMLDLDSRDDTATLAKPGMRLDLNGIAEGYAGDMALAAMSATGIHRALVDISGDIVAGDAPPEQPAWVVEVQLGTGEGRPILIPLRHAAVSTSGDTYQYLEIDGKRYSHIIDPRTGMGSTVRACACVVAPRGWMADALATAGGVGGSTLPLFPEEANGDDLPGMVTYMLVGVDDAGSVTTTGSPEELAKAGARGADAREVEVMLKERENLGALGHDVMLMGYPPRRFEALFTGDPAQLANFQGLIELPTRDRMTPEERATAQKAADENMRAHWTVQDGVLFFDGGGASLQTVKDYGDVQLMLDWKIAPGGDSGIYLRGNPQVQIWDNAVGSGGLYNNQLGESKPLEVADRPVGDWNRMLIEIKGDVTSVWLNGRLVVDHVRLENYWERGAGLPETGPIELQAHGTALWFRNVYVRELP